MAQRMSQEAKIFWERVFREVTAPERFGKLLWFIRRLLLWVRDRDRGLFRKLLHDLHWLNRGYKLPSKVLDWMEVVFSCNLSMEPRKVADQACSIFRINPLMRNLLIKEARKVKKRVAMRKRRSWARDPYLIELIGEEGKHCPECPVLRVLGWEG